MNSDLKAAEKSGEHFDIASAFPMLFGQACGGIKEVLPAKDIVEEMMTDCIATLQSNANLVAKL